MNPLRCTLARAALCVTLLCVTSCGGSGDGPAGTDGGGGGDTPPGADIVVGADVAPTADAGAHGGGDGGGADTGTTDTATTDGATGDDAATPPDAAGDATPGADGTADGHGPGDGGADAAANMPPVFDPLPTLTLDKGTTTTLDLNPYVADAEDADALLVFEWSAAHVALDDPGDHVLVVVAPVDWAGTEEIELTVVDRGGLTASSILTVVVEEGTVDPPDPPDPDCGTVTFRFAAGAAAEVVLLSGTFNGWGDSPATADIMTDPDGDGVFEVTLTLADGTYAYKFVVDGEWLADPDNPNTEDDGYGGVNSVIVVDCDGTDPGPDPMCGEATFRYDAGDDTPAGVFVAGSFNGWDPAADALLDPDGDGVFEVTLALEPGRYTYKFVVDGAWLVDPTNPDTEDDGRGGQNSVLVVPACPAAGALVLVSHDTDEATGAFTATFSAAEPVDPAAVTVTVEHAAAPAGALTADDDGTTLALALTGLADGIHDVRVTSGGETLLLKVYVGVSTDWRDAVLYFAMTDRFANGDPSNDAPVPDVDPRVNYQGGDFAGLTQVVASGYFDDLGVGAIWVSWPVDNPDGYEEGSFVDQDGCGLNASTAHTSPMRYTGYHGYWPSDLDRTDEHFGTLEELQTFVSAAHARGIRVLLDFTANHVHDSSPLFAAHRDDGWFNFPIQVCEDVGWDNAPETCWFTDYLADLDYRNAAARAALIDHAVDWAKRTGADGFRLDAVKHVNLQFVEELRTALRDELELTGVDFYVVGETFTGDAGLIASYVGPDRLHGQFDFPANLQIRKAFATYEIGLDAMDAAVRGAHATYGAGALMSPFVGNHDIARFVSQAAGSIHCGVWDVVSNIAQGWRNPPGAPGDEAPYRKLRLAFVYALTIPGVPLVYYGDEFGMPGAGDPDNRRFMRFGADLSAHESATLAALQQLGQARAAHPALRTGDWRGPLLAEGDLLAYARVHPDETAIVVINRGGDRSGSIGVGGLGLADGTRLVDALDAGGAAETVGSGQLPFSVPGLSARIYVTE